MSIFLVSEWLVNFSFLMAEKKTTSPKTSVWVGHKLFRGKKKYDTFAERHVFATLFCLFVFLFVCLFVCLTVCLFVCLSFRTNEKQREFVNKLNFICANRRTSEQTNRQTDKQTNRQTDKQTNKLPKFIWCSKNKPLRRPGPGLAAIEAARHDPDHAVHDLLR